MAERRFQSRRQWHNTRLVLYAGPFLLLFGLLAGVTTGRFISLAILLGMFGAAMVAAVLRDASHRATYILHGTEITLIKGADTVKLDGNTIIDASLLDRQSAREYFNTKILVKAGSKRGARRSFLRFCTVDIGLQTFTFGLGRGLIDRMPDARQDLVLLRLRNQDDLLLSPQYNHDLVETILRLQRRARESA